MELGINSNVNVAPTEDQQKQMALNTLCRMLSDHSLNQWDGPQAQPYEVLEAAIAPVKEAIKVAIKNLL